MRLDQHIDDLEAEIDRVRDDPDLTEEEREKEILELRRDIRDSCREESDREHWEDEGRERGWVSW